LLKFVHAADFHLDSPFAGLSEVEPEMQKLLREATFEAFTNVIDLCLNESVDFLLVAGDVYDGKDRSLRAQLRFRDGLKRLSDAGIRTYIVHGNHDPLDGWTASLQWPDLVHIFGGKVETVEFVRDGEVRAIIHGISFEKNDIKDNLALKFRRQNSPLFQIGLLHCMIGSSAIHKSYAPCTIADLDAARLDYWALGHVHKMQVLKEHGPHIAYSGNTQGRHINEGGPRGCFLVSVDDGGDIQTRFVPTDVVRWHNAKLSIEGIADDDALLNGIQQCLMDVQTAADGRPAICRLSVAGRGPMHAELRRAERLDEYVAVARGFGMRLSPRVCLADIKLKTSPEIDIELRMGSEDIVGDCLRLLRNARSDQDRSAELIQSLDELFMHSQVRRYLEPLDDEARDEVLMSAQSLLLDSLLGDEK